MPLTSHKLTLLAAVGAAGLGGSAIAAATTGATGSSGATGATGSSGSKQAGQRPNETALTGETAAKVKAAALAKQPGTVLRVETDEGGVYEAHIRKADGSEVEVRVNASFAVTQVVARDGRRDGHGERGGHGGRGGGGAGETALTGTTASKVRAAALEKVPGGAVLRVESDNGGVYEAHVRKSDGSEVEVSVDKSFAVTAVEEHGDR